MSDTKGRSSGLRREAVEVEILGELCRGERIVSGLHELHQAVQYEALRVEDPNDYDPDDQPLMRDVAQRMLRDLVRRWASRHQPVRVPPTEPGREESRSS